MSDYSLPVSAEIEPSATTPELGTFLEKLHGWVVTVDHKRLGILYILYSTFFLLVAGAEALLIRIQLAYPQNHVLSAQVYNRFFTMHGTTMVFLVGMPFLFGFANYIVPLQIGARDMAFPRLNAFSFWLTAFGGFLLYYSFLGGAGLYGVGNAPDVGWFAYAPLTARSFSPGHATDYWALALIVSGFGTLGTAINIIATIVAMRCKGMTLMRMPLFTWLLLVVSMLTLVTITPLTAAQFMLLIDRYLGGHFFDTQAGGSSLIWIHFFWIFGHPEVYVLVLPAFAIANEIIPVFCRKAIFGYPAMVAASVAIMFVSLSVWAHHMFTVGMTSVSNAFFTLSTMLVGVPTGIKIFNWIATLWGGRIRFTTPMLFCIGFLFQFLIAGLTGIMLSVSPWDWQLHNSYFVIAHFHYVLVGAIVFCIFAGIYYWYPKATGRYWANATTADIAAFHWKGLITATIIHSAICTLIGLLYGAMLPMWPRRPILLGGIVAPLLWTGLIHSILGFVNPAFNARIAWGWFTLSEILFGIVAGIVVTRSGKIRTHQTLPFLLRMGIEAKEFMPPKEDE